MLSLHNHTDHSNYRLLDSMNTVEGLLKYAKELGLQGIAITDHDTVGAHGEALHLIRDLRKLDPSWDNFKLILGNEIYLCSHEDIDNHNYVFPHFILLAKNAMGHKALRELSTRAWCENSFTYVNLRVPTYYEDLFDVMKDYKGDVIASTACIGGYLPKAILEAVEQNPDNPDFHICKKWINKMVEVFGRDNFYLELQPSIQPEQDIVNKYLLILSKETGVPYIITTDAHYLKKDDRKIHEAFLNSQEADREVGDFYATTYLMSEEEIHSYLDDTIGAKAVEEAFANTLKIGESIEEYTLDKPLNIPYVPADITEPSIELYNKYKPFIPLLEYFYTSKYDSDRHLVREIINKIHDCPDEFENEEAYEAINTCLNSIKLSSEKQNTSWSAYLLQTKELINICWESNSLVGCSRGSGCGFVLLYMLGITQVNPLREEVKTFHWRFLNPERVSPLDIDVDVQGPLRDAIVRNLQTRYGGYRHVTKVQTILKAKSKNAIQIACRGLGYTPEEGTFLGSFIKAERGIQYTLRQTFYGDEDNNIAPDTEFVNLMTNKYPDVWEIAQRIEGLCVGTGQHAGGVILCKEDLVDNVALMKTKSGDVTTQFDLHQSEAMSLIKWDILGIDALEKIRNELELLLEDKRIEWQGSLKATYEKYLGVYNIERNNPAIWDMIDNHEIISLFQMEKSTGWACIEAGKPRSLQEMSALNSVMRLMPPDPNSETPLQRYSRYKQDIGLWYKEMTDYGLTPKEQEIVAKYALKSYGLLPNQEDFMQIVQDPEIGGFDLLWADRLRKSIAKKSPKDYHALQEEFYQNIKDKGLSDKLCHYVWDILIAMNRGYGFNTSHTLGYSIIALQEANLAYHYPIIYWNCANLISDSGGTDSTVNYGKIAAAIGRMRKEGITIVPPYINEARFGFKPDVNKNEIVYGLKAVAGIGASVAQAIVENQPYTSMTDFYNKMQKVKIDDNGFTFGDTAMIQLIKAGAFDLIEHKPRINIMTDFIRSISNPIKNLSISNIEDLNKLGLLSEAQKANELRYVRYRSYVFQKSNLVKMTGKSPATGFYRLEPRYAAPYFTEHFKDYLEEFKDYDYDDNGYYIVKRGSFDRIFDQKMADFKQNVLNNSKYLAAVNNQRFKDTWVEKASGSVSKWEMDSLYYYYGEHELANVDAERYNLANFDELPVEPEIVDQYYYRGQAKPRYNLVQIAGTVIDKDKNHHTVTLLTPSGVVVVKLYKGQFGFYDREISELKSDGSKTKIEKSWFKRGTKLIVTGFRNEEYFIPRKYGDSIYNHTIRLIKNIDKDNNLIIQTERAGMEGETQ